VVGEGLREVSALVFAEGGEVRVRGVVGGREVVEAWAWRTRWMWVL
jgi:hypothetical protein